MKLDFGPRSRSRLRWATNRTLSLAALSVTLPLTGATAFGNAGVQLPLNQYQAGSEQTNNSLITNPGFEQPGSTGTIATGWTNSGNMFVAPPDAAHLPNPASAIGNFSAKANNANINFNEMYSQSVTLAPNTDYVISAYIWNYGLAGPNPPNDLGAGDLAVVEIRDDTNFFNSAGISLERTAIDGGDGANGYFVYKSFSSSWFPAGTTLEILSDPNEDLPGARPTLIAQFDNIAITPVNQFAAQKWNTTGGGNWTNASNWLNGVPNNKSFTQPQGTGEGSAIASFGNAITGAATVTLDSPQGVTAINFDSANSYTIAGTATLTLAHQEDREPVLLNVNQGSHAILTPVLVRQPTPQGVTNFGPRILRTNILSNSTLTVSNDVVSNNATVAFNLQKQGAGRLNMKNVRAGSVVIFDGSVGVLPNGTNSGASQISTLAIAAGAKLDLNDNDLIVRTGTRQSIEALVVTGRAGGAWTGNGITSTAAKNANPKNTTLGVLSGSEYLALPGSPTHFDGFLVAATDNLVKYTYYGDTDFNGVVNFDDYSRIDSGFNAGRTGWLNGDFDFSGTVNFDDYAQIDLAFNSQSGTLRRAAQWLSGGGGDMDEPSLKIVEDHYAQFGDGYANSFLSAIPEPGSVSLVFAGTLMAGRRRRRAPSQAICRR